MSEIKEGIKNEIAFTCQNVQPQAFVFGASNPDIKWSFDFKVTLEEVEQE